MMCGPVVLQLSEVLVLEAPRIASANLEQGLMMQDFLCGLYAGQPW
jgi:hypothetical protein